MKKPMVAFDEAGYTGQNLLDDSQPVFVLASVNFGDEEARELIRMLTLETREEFHFIKFRKSSAGRKRILKCLDSELVSCERVRLSVFHKKYMIVTKIVDLLIENLCHETGFDLYKKGANIALANLYYICIPLFCGKKNFQVLLERFVNMIRSKNLSAVKDFYAHVGNLSVACKHKPFEKDIDLIMMTQVVVLDLLARCDGSELDPAIPAFVNDCAAWGQELGGEFDVLHDQSKPIEHWEEILSFLMAKDEPDVTIGYDRRKVRLPLKAVGIKFCDSKLVPQIQIADLLASAYAYWVKGTLGGKVDKRFLETLSNTKLPNLKAFTVWPSDKVTPQDLGTNEEGGINIADYMAELIARQEKKRRKVKE